MSAIIPRILHGFLSPRERMAIAALARSGAKRGAFEPGRQGTGYEKLDVRELPAAERLIRRCVKELGDPLLFDAWLLRYPVGSEIPVHTDPPAPGLHHVRLNALAITGSGGVLYIDGAEVPLDGGDAYLFRPDLMRHQVTRVEQNERLMWSVGANVDEAHARRLGML